MSKQKQTMLTAKYDMKMLKQIVEIDDGMKARLCELVGVEDEVRLQFVLSFGQKPRDGYRLSACRSVCLPACLPH